MSRFTQQKAPVVTDCAWPRDVQISAYARVSQDDRRRCSVHPRGEGEVSLTAAQVRLVRETYTVIGGSPDRYSELFYHRLLLNHPFARALFPDDMTHQIAVFEKTIDVLVENIHEIARLRPKLSALAKQHVKYGVQAYQYQAVGTVLIETFAEMLGPRFTVDARQAWEAVYAETAGVMISEAYPVDGARPQDGS